MRLVVVLYALSLVAYPVWGLVSPEAYRETLSALPQAAGAGLEKLQMAAALHFMKNAYLAFLMLLLARFLGSPDRPRDVRTAGILLVAFPVVTLVYVVLAQVALSSDPEDINLKIRLGGELLLYGILGLTLIGISRYLETENTTTNTVYTDDAGPNA